MPNNNDIKKILNVNNEFPIGNKNLANEDCNKVVDRIINNKDMKELFKSLSKK